MIKLPLYAIVGLVLFVLYIVQWLLGLEWAYLTELQSDEMYKRWSGLALTIVIILQWVLTIVKISKRWQGNAPLFADIHKWVGALSPIVFYFHCTQFGYAYLFFLSVIFFSNLLTALLNPEAINYRTNWYLQLWMIIHVSTSLLISTIMVYHVWVVFSYK